MDWVLSVRGTHDGDPADVEEAAAQAFSALGSVGAHGGTLQGSRADGAFVTFEPPVPGEAEPADDETTPDEPAETGGEG